MQRMQRRRAIQPIAFVLCALCRLRALAFNGYRLPCRAETKVRGLAVTPILHSQSKRTAICVIAVCDCVFTLASGCGRPASDPTKASLRPAPVVAPQAAPAATAAATTSGDANYLSDELPAEPPSPLVVVQSPPPGARGIALPDPNKLVIAPDSVSSVSRSRAVGGRAKLPFSLVDEASILADDASQHRPGRPTGPKATIHIFDSPPVAGHSFVFVIDRSASMGAGGLGAIGAAAKELAAQLKSLSADQKVQVVAYNNRRSTSRAAS